METLRRLSRNHRIAALVVVWVAIAIVFRTVEAMRDDTPPPPSEVAVENSVTEALDKRLTKVDRYATVDTDCVHKEARTYICHLTVVDSKDRKDESAVEVVLGDDGKFVATPYGTRIAGDVN